MRNQRLNESLDKKENRQIKDKVQKRQTMSNENESEKHSRNEKNKAQMKQHRLTETGVQRSKRCLKIKDNMRKIRSNHSQLKRLQRFQESVRYGPIFTCTVCEQDMFKNSVVILTDTFEEEVRKNSSELFKKVLINKHKIELKGELNVYICGTCKKHLKKGKLPAMAAANGLAVFPITDKDLNLTELENNLIAKRLMFQKIYQLPKSRMAACKDRLINIPISSNDVINTLKNLPRTPQEAGLLEVKLKRKLEYKNTHKQAYIDPKKNYKALEFLKSTGHPDYQFFDDYRAYKQRCFHTKMEFVNDDLIEAIVDMPEFLQNIKNDKDKENINNIDEEEEYVTKDVIRKFQFDYDKSVCLVEQYPEAAIQEEDTIDSNQISFAPGEGKIPENILNTENWDRDAFPMKHPDGKNNLHQDRKVKLTDQYYFVERLRNKDTRFSNDPAYVFAAAAYLEKKQLQSNINVSYQRGKEIKSLEGVSTFHLEDGFSVFDKISNTPKYWKNAKYEMLAKLDNLGPFQFFFTLSCADMRWNENFSAILRKLGVRIEYEVLPDGSEKTWVKDKNDQLVELREYLEQNIDSSLHEMIRTHIFIATRNYNNRVKAFIRDIITDKNNPMHVKYWSTKVEFQGRGAAHNHRTIWVDMKKMELTCIDDEGKWFDLDSLLKLSKVEITNIKKDLKRILTAHFVEEAVIEENDAISLQNIYCQLFQTEENQTDIELNPNEFFDKFLIRFPLFGITAAFKKFQTKEKLLEHEEQAVIAFVNKFTTCTLNEAVIASKTDDETLKKRARDIVQIVEAVNKHRDTKSCRKYNTKCRFGFPRFPIWKTLISRPMETSGEEGDKLKQKYKKVLKDVKELLDEKGIMESILEKTPKDLDTTLESYQKNRKKRVLKLLSIAGYKSEEEI